MKDDADLIKNVVKLDFYVKPNEELRFLIEKTLLQLRFKSPSSQSRGLHEVIN